MRNARQRWTALVTYGFLAITTLFVLLPIVWNLLTSFKPALDAFRIPPRLFFKPTLESYVTALWDPDQLLAVDIPQYALNSLVVSFGATIVAVFGALLSAYSLSRFRFRGQAIVAGFIVATRMLPPIATVIPLFLLGMNLGLLDTKLLLVLAYTALNLPFATWLLRSFFSQVPEELEDAALIDGCSRMQTLWKIIIPLMKPGVASAAVFCFLLAWNDLPVALVLTSREARTLPIALLAFKGEEGVMWGPMTASAALMMVPGILLVAVAQRHLVQGLTAGAVKG